jgi:hypothetical protein
MNQALDLSPGLAMFPVAHGSADFSLEVLRRLRREAFDCIALALPASFADPVERGVELLPRISLVLQREGGLEESYNCVPVDPSQPMIAAARHAIETGIDLAYVDLEVEAYEPYGQAMPDAYALKHVELEAFAAALLPSLEAPPPGSQRLERIRRMAHQLHLLELEYRRIAFVCSVADWPWIRQAYQRRDSFEAHRAGAGMPELRRVAPESLYFVLGELPYITYLYEHRRAELLGEGSLGIDGIKTLVLEAAQQHRGQGGQEWLTPQRLRLFFVYVRNLSLTDRRLTPDMYNLALAAKQVAGDRFALDLVKLARQYPPQRLPTDLPPVDIGPDQIVGEAGEAVPCKNRLQGPPLLWRSLPLKPEPPPPEKKRWTQQWDPFGQCSHLPEDKRIESFQQHVRQQAKALVGRDLARTEKFTSSLKDGLDVRETLRHWQTGELFVREEPPVRGEIEIVVFIFATPADPRRYSWTSTWYAEHDEESTLSFFATPFLENMVGPGIGQAMYGGCLFLFPPRPIPDIWSDERLDFATGLEERLVAGACLHSRSKKVAIVAPVAPPTLWRRSARRFGKQLVYLPLKRFSGQMVDRLRRFHVLNGREVRSYASRYIRDFR